MTAENSNGKKIPIISILSESGPVVYCQESGCRFNSGKRTPLGLISENSAGAIWEDLPIFSGSIGCVEYAIVEDCSCPFVLRLKRISQLEGICNQFRPKQ